MTYLTIKINKHYNDLQKYQNIIRTTTQFVTPEVPDIYANFATKEPGYNNLENKFTEKEKKKKSMALVYLSQFPLYPAYADQFQSQIVIPTTCKR
ncbi:9000_t:CDS:2 [Diversispora eburnea]|uniref:9000_t:CDS:1 n=1 Tax=Diversispora eburnea TaxID=1213867 RepID=A0A9N8VNQ2_9GLOM|nr:9000_t:CDS:2 [Diversispora eburnea]